MDARFQEGEEVELCLEQQSSCREGFYIRRSLNPPSLPFFKGGNNTPTVCDMIKQDE